MNCIRCSFAGALAATVMFAAVTVAGQTAQAPMKSVLAGKKLVAPAKGNVLIEFTNPVITRTKTDVVTTVLVKNVGNAPIARLTINETWFSDAGAVVSGNKGFIDGLLQPGEVKQLKIETPFKPGMSRSSYKFSHANGTVGEKRVAKLVVTPAK
jgi:hypothetical protein